MPHLPTKALTTGLSGNEMYCLHQKGLSPGNLVIGNSVVSLGVVGGLASGVRTLVGGEINEVTSLIQEGRERSYARMEAEAKKHGGVGITGVSSELILHQGNVEFLSVGSCVHREADGLEKIEFSTSADGQELFCQLDCGFEPRSFVFGNVAYSIGLGGGVMGLFRSLKRGEVHEFSQIFRETRSLALKRIMADAMKAGANAVVGIETSILPFMGMQEMLMIGTASHHPLLVNYNGHPITSDLTNEEMWNVVKMGYMPLQLVMGVSVYSIGLVGGLVSGFQSLVRTELDAMTSLIYEARENAIARIHEDAERVGADAVMGIRTYVYELGGGLVEFLAIGTAVKRVQGLSTQSEQLPPQAIIVDRDTFVNTADGTAGMGLNAAGGRRSVMRGGSPAAGLIAILIAAALFFLKVVLHVAGR